MVSKPSSREKGAIWSISSTLSPMFPRMKYPLRIMLDWPSTLKHSRIRAVSKPFLMERSVLSWVDSIPSISMKNPAFSILRNTSGRWAISNLALMMYFFRMPRDRIRSQIRSTLSMSKVKRSSVKAMTGASIRASSSATDSGDRADHCRLLPQGFRLKEQKLQLNGQPREEDTMSIRIPASTPSSPSR